MLVSHFEIGVVQNTEPRVQPLGRIFEQRDGRLLSFYGGAFEELAKVVRAVNEDGALDFELVDLD